MDHVSLNNNVTNFDSLELDNIGKQMDNICSGAAGDNLIASLNDLSVDITNIKTSLQTFVSALEDLEVLLQIKKDIDTLQEQIDGFDIYSLVDGEYVVDNAKVEQRDALIAAKNEKVEEYNELKQQIIGKLTSIDGEVGSKVVPTSAAGELSYDDAVVLAEKLQVPVEYILSLHLHEGYQIGDRLIPEGITPDIIHYAGPNGYPILIGGIDARDENYRADAPERNTYFIKTEGNHSLVGGGREYQMMGWPITYGEFEGPNTYWTYYGPICQGQVLGVDAAPVQCTDTNLYPCDDGFYRDQDGYIVLAGTPYINQFYNDGRTVNYEANGGMAYEDMFVVTPFGLGRFYDHASQKVPDGIYVDFYMNDGYESNNIAQTEAGRKLRPSAVEGYESSDLYWQDMVH